MLISTNPKEGYWKLNTQILKDVTLQYKITGIISKYLEDKTEKQSTFTKYNRLKGDIQNLLKERSIERAKQRHKKRTETEKNIETCTQIIEDKSQKFRWKKMAIQLLTARKALAVNRTRRMGQI